MYINNCILYADRQKTYSLPYIIGLVISIMCIPLLLHIYVTYILCLQILQLVVVPVQLYRAKLENEQLFEKFGEDYIMYKETVYL